MYHSNVIEMEQKGVFIEVTISSLKVQLVDELTAINEVFNCEFENR